MGGAGGRSTGLQRGEPSTASSRLKKRIVSVVKVPTGADRYQHHEEYEGDYDKLQQGGAVLLLIFNVAFSHKNYRHRLLPTG